MTSISLALLMVTTCHAQFDFEKEVAGFFDFGKIPSEFTDPPSILNFYKSTTSPGNHPSSPPTTAAPSPFAVFSSSIPDNSIDDNEDIGQLVYYEEHNEEGPLLPEFGEIQHNLTEKIDVNVTDDDSETRGVKKRSYGSGHGHGGGGGYSGGGGHGGGGGYGGGDDHISSGYGGGGSSHGGGGYGAGGHSSGGYDDHKGGLVSYGGHEGQKISPKPPGPFGPPSPNYRCQKTKETLFVTKVDFTTDQKCFTVFSVDCYETYDTGKVGVKNKKDFTVMSS